MGQATEILLPLDCTIYEVAEWQHKVINQWSDHCLPLKFNLADVQEMDACFIQLILSCYKTANDYGSSCTLKNVPTHVEQRIKQMQVPHLLAKAEPLEVLNNG